MSQPETTYYLDVLKDGVIIDVLRTKDQSKISELETQAFKDHGHKGSIILKRRKSEPEYEVVSECKDGVCPVRTRLK